MSLKTHKKYMPWIGLAVVALLVLFTALLRQQTRISDDMALPIISHGFLKAQAQVDVSKAYTYVENPTRTEMFLNQGYIFKCKNGGKSLMNEADSKNMHVSVYKFNGDELINQIEGRSNPFNGTKMLSESYKMFSEKQYGKYRSAHKERIEKNTLYNAFASTPAILSCNGITPAPES